jgi:transcriptional regulator with XRE-family HTH domain
MDAKKLAEAARMNELQIGHIERGASDPNSPRFLKLAKALSDKAEELVRGP